MCSTVFITNIVIIIIIYRNNINSTSRYQYLWSHCNFLTSAINEKVIHPTIFYNYYHPPINGNDQPSPLYPLSYDLSVYLQGACVWTSLGHGLVIGLRLSRDSHEWVTLPLLLPYHLKKEDYIYHQYSVCSPDAPRLTSPLTSKHSSCMWHWTGYMRSIFTTSLVCHVTRHL